LDATINEFIAAAISFNSLTIGSMNFINNNVFNSIYKSSLPLIDRKLSRPLESELEWLRFNI